MTLLIAVLLIGLLIVVHELGHLLAAKLAGIRVLRFSLGFGPVLLRWRRGETEYALSALPLGGYVKMAGDDPNSLRGSPDEFLSAPLPKRLAVAGAGPLANLFLGFLLFLAVVWGVGLSEPATDRIWVEEGSPAWEAGLRPEDRIPGLLWSHLPRLPAELTVVRGRDTLRVRVTSWEGLAPWIPPRVGRVLPGEPGGACGLRPGDLILAVDGKRVSRWEELVQSVESKPGDTISLTVLREGDTLSLRCVPKPTPTLRDGRETTVGKLGVLAETRRLRPSPGRALWLALWETLSAAGFIYFLLLKMLTGAVGLGSLGGPIMVGKALSQSAGTGLDYLLSTAGLISVNLAVVNLLPLPALDGGHLCIFILEALARRRIPPKWYLRIQVVGVLLLLVLLLALTVWDILRLVGV